MFFTAVFFIFAQKSKMNNTISKQKIKWIRSFELKKNREKEQLFIAEGVKLVTELLEIFQCEYLAINDTIQLENRLLAKAKQSVFISKDESKKLSSQKNPQGVLGVFHMSKSNYNQEDIAQKLTLFLENIQDPGNLGTIIRLADWYGIKDVFCSKGTVDVFNPKTIQATMGAIARVRVHYVDKTDFLQTMSEKTTIYGTFLEGENIYQTKLSQKGIIVMGNEGKGISEQIEPFITQRITIPTFPKNSSTSESLNVGVATAIVISEFRRKEW